MFAILLIDLLEEKGVKIREPEWLWKRKNKKVSKLQDDIQKMIA